jgi:formyl-CoA transferase
MEIDHPIEGKVKNIGFPVKLLGTPQQVRRHPPLLGEHNEEILAEINAPAGAAEAL